MESLDPHCRLIIDEYREALPVLKSMKEQVLARLHKALERSSLIVTAVEARVKTEGSLVGKLARKGNKYASLSDITDLVGARIITFYTDDVDRIASMAEKLFEIDWANSVDKRKLHQLDSFGYNSLHYICRIPDYDFRFELQLRTTLQHAWAAINHDTGYKSGIEIPQEYMRRMNRLAGMLEMADDEFSRIRTELTDYRRRARTLVQKTPLSRFLRVFKALKCDTLGDVDRLIKRYEEDAYLLARHQLGNTDIDIISSAIGLQNICIVCVLSNGGGKIGLERLFDAINGHNTQNTALASLTYEQAKNLPFMQNNM